MDISKEISNRVPDFVKYNDGLDNLEYLDLENLFSVLSDLIYVHETGELLEEDKRFHTEGKDIKSFFPCKEKSIKAIFQFIDLCADRNYDQMKITAFETLTLNKFGHIYCKKYLSESLFQKLHLDFPENKYEANKNYYSKEDLDRKLKSLE